MAKTKAEVDTSKIKTGMVIKNYIDFCNLLGEQAVSGTSKIIQMKRWERYIEFKKVERSHAYEIISVYETPKEKPEDGRNSEKIRRGKYKQYLQHLIMMIALCSDDNTVRTSKRQFLRALGLLPPKLHGAITDAQIETDKENEYRDNVAVQTAKSLSEQFGSMVKVMGIRDVNYFEIMLRDLRSYYSNDVLAMEAIENMTHWSIRNFVNRVDMKGRGLFTSTLRSMEKHGLIKTFSSYNVKREKSDLYLSAVDRTDDDDVKYNEQEVIEIAMGNALNKIGCKSESDAYLSNKWNIMHDTMITELHEKYGISEVQRMLRITVKVDDYETPSYLKDMELWQIIKELNRVFIQGIRHQAFSQRQKLIKSKMDKNPDLLKVYQKERTKYNYLDIQDLLTNHYLTISDDEAKALAKNIEIGIVNYIDRE